MLITNYYRGTTDMLSGFIYDTTQKTYKEFSIPGKKWTKEIVKNNYVYTLPKDDFISPGDISYYFSTKYDMKVKLDEIKKLGFVEDRGITIDFGILKI